MKRKEIGAIGEEAARKFLKKRGYKILETNFRCPLGEIDIVARHKKELVFVEVRSRTGGELGAPEESITSKKKRKLRKLADFYLKTKTSKPPDGWRIDVVAVRLSPKGEVLDLKLIESAVEGKV